MTEIVFFFFFQKIIFKLTILALTCRKADIVMKFEITVKAKPSLFLFLRYAVFTKSHANCLKLVYN